MSSMVTLSYNEGFSFFGVQFKPGGISYFVDQPITEYAEKLLEFDDSGLSSIIDDDRKLASRIDLYFISRLRKRLPVSPIIESIISQQGQISIADLTRKFSITYRTLERLFNNRVGLSPKEFISLIRFKNAMGKILKKSFGNLDESLMSIAFDAGYYDHAHLTREIKRFTGFTPSEIIQLEETNRMFVAEFQKYPVHDRSR